MNMAPEFAQWFSGFVDGEGCFSSYVIRRTTGTYYYATFSIGCRADDMAILEYIKEHLGFGRLNINAKQKILNRKKADYICAPAAYFQITTVRDQLLLIDLFDAYPLHSKKSKDYDIWKQMVLALSVPFEKRNFTLIEGLRTELSKCKEYSIDSVPSKWRYRL